MLTHLLWLYGLTISHEWEPAGTYFDSFLRHTCTVIWGDDYKTMCMWLWDMEDMTQILEVIPGECLAMYYGGNNV